MSWDTWAQELEEAARLERIADPPPYRRGDGGDSLREASMRSEHPNWRWAQYTLE